MSHIKASILDYLYLVRAMIYKNIPSPSNFIMSCELEKDTLYELNGRTFEIPYYYESNSFSCIFPEECEKKVHIYYHSELNQLFHYQLEQILEYDLEFIQIIFEKYGIQIFHYESGFEIPFENKCKKHKHFFYHAIAFDPNTKGIIFESNKYSIGDIIELVSKDTFMDKPVFLSKLLDYVHNYFIGFSCAMDLIYVPWESEIGNITNNLTKYYKSIKHLLHIDAWKN